MEVKKIEQPAGQFWPKFLKRQITLVVGIQSILVMITAGIFYVLNIYKNNLVLGVTFLVAFYILSLGLGLLALYFISRPTKDLIAAIVSLSDEHTTLVPPNPNNYLQNDIGMHDALQLVYSQAASKVAKKSGNDSDSSHNEIAARALDYAFGGLVCLDDKHQVTYSNNYAPVSVGKDGTKKLQLIFNNWDNLDDWLDECAKSQIKSEKIWSRIPDRLPNEEGRRIFDVYASYQKGANPETVLILADRTKNYNPDEEDLDFISFAAHELRGPVTVIRGYVDILNDELSGVMQGDQQQLFSRLVVSANRLSGYIDNILNTSSYDRRHLKMNLAEVSVGEVFDIIKDDIKLRATTQNCLLSVNIPDNLPKIAADRASLSQVLNNLIDNAIKYSHQGGTVNVKAQQNGNIIDISVEDNGIGMPDSVIGHLFEKFYRSHRSRESVAGTGIGLYVSKAIVESHGGIISVKSEDGKGSTFTVSLPTYQSIAEKLKATGSSNQELINEGRGWIKNHSMYRD